jgi:hypothetical protein
VISKNHSINTTRSLIRSLHGELINYSIFDSIHAYNGICMKRTTIFADESLLKALLDIAHHERSSLASIIRRALEEFVGRRQGTGTLPSCAGIGRSGRKDIAERAEELLWTSPHAKRKS